MLFERLLGESVTKNGDIVIITLIKCMAQPQTSELFAFRLKLIYYFLKFYFCLFFAFLGFWFKVLL